MNPPLLLHRRRSALRSDSNRLHKECLAAIYATKESDDLPRCPSCHDTYRVTVRYRFMFAWHRVMTCRSVGHLFEMLIIVAMIGCGLFTLHLFHQSPEYLSKHRRGHEKTDFASYLIYFLFAVTMCLVPFTLKKVFERWRNVNSDVEVDIV